MGERSPIQRRQRRQGAAYAARRTHFAQDPRRGARRVRRTGIFRQFDRRDHAARRSRARHLLHLLQFQGGGVPGTRARYVRAGPGPCRTGVQGRDRRARRRAPRARIVPQFRAQAPRCLSHHRRGGIRRTVCAYREHYETTAIPHRRAVQGGARQGRDRAGPVRRGSRHPRLGIDGGERVPWT